MLSTEEMRNVLVKASDLLVRCLEAEGVEYIFGIPGEENIDVMDSLTRSPIKFVLTRHEQGAAFMADVYARVTGKPGVCLATLGPGATNLITGVANAHLDRSPVIAITGQAVQTRLHKESHQNVDTVQLFKGITKYDQQIFAAQTIPEIVRKAFQLATSGSPGAVHLQLPEDVAKEEVDAHPLPIRVEAKSYAHKAAFEEAAQLIRDAKNPIILAGHGIVRNQAWAEVQRLVERANVPLVNTFMAKGILPFTHPRNLFTVGKKPRDINMRPLHHADLIIAIGFDLVEYDPVDWNLDQSRKVLNIHSTPADTDTHFPVELELIGDLQDTVEALSRLVEKRQNPDLFDQIRASRLHALTSIPSPSEELPWHIMWTMSKILPQDTIVISDVGLHKVWTALWYQPATPGRTIIFNGFASMGGSLPGAIGSRLGRPSDSVVIVTGDAGFMMNSQELETAKRMDVAFTVILFNDERLSLIEKHQRDSHLAVTEISFTNPDFALYAQSFGVDHRRVTTATEFETALLAAVQSDQINLLEVTLGGH